MKRTFGILPFLISLLFLSCEKDSDPCAGIEASPYDIMQPIVLVEPDEWGHIGNRWGISDIANKTIELIAMTENWRNPVRNGEGKTVKQIAGQIEARPKGGSYSPGSYMELYMAGTREVEDSYFILKIDYGLWFRIRAKYYWDSCRHVNLKGFVFEDDKEYVEGDLKHIHINEKKKREELKEMYPNGFPHKL